MPSFVASYVHGEGAAAALVLLRFRESLSSRTAEFQLLGRELAMQVVAMKPLVVAPRDIDDASWRQELARQRGSQHSAAKESGEDAFAPIRAARERYERNCCLLKQPFIKSNSLSVEERIAEVEAALSEKIEVIRFSLVQASEVPSEA